jgi:hypothetical protein
LLGVRHRSCLLQQAYCEGFPSPHFSAQGALSSLLRVFFVVIAYYSVFFFFFPWVGGQSVQGAMLILPRIVCGSSVCCLAHLVVCFFPSGLGTGVWHLVAAWEPSWLLHSI